MLPSEVERALFAKVDLKALARRLTEAGNAPTIMDPMRTDLNDAADLTKKRMAMPRKLKDVFRCYRSIPF
jgi:hypothetical protein